MLKPEDRICRPKNPDLLTGLLQGIALGAESCDRKNWLAKKLLYSRTWNASLVSRQDFWEKCLFSH